MDILFWLGLNLITREDRRWALAVAMDLTVNLGEFESSDSLYIIFVILTP